MGRRLAMCPHSRLFWTHTLAVALPGIVPRIDYSQGSYISFPLPSGRNAMITISVLQLESLHGGSKSDWS
jgi:hypothetical protein